jgi:hypothetical protein
MPDSQLIIARLYEHLEPMDRGERYEDPLQTVLEAAGLGRVTGGGSQLNESGGSEFAAIMGAGKASRKPACSFSALTPTHCFIASSLSSVPLPSVRMRALLCVMENRPSNRVPCECLTTRRLPNVGSPPTRRDAGRRNAVRLMSALGNTTR